MYCSIWNSTDKLGMAWHNLFTPDTETATWSICGYQYQSDTFIFLKYAVDCRCYGDRDPVYVKIN